MQFTLYVTDRNARRSVITLERLGEIVHDVEGGAFIDVVDVLADPEAAERERIVATPTVVRDVPAPHRRVVGDLADSVVVREAFGLDHRQGALEGGS